MRVPPSRSLPRGQHWCLLGAFCKYLLGARRAFCCLNGIPGVTASEQPSLPALSNVACVSIQPLDSLPSYRGFSRWVQPIGGTSAGDTGRAGREKLWGLTLPPPLPGFGSPGLLLSYLSLSFCPSQQGVVTTLCHC